MFKWQKADTEKTDIKTVKTLKTANPADKPGVSKDSPSYLEINEIIVDEKWSELPMGSDNQQKEINLEQIENQEQNGDYSKSEIEDGKFYSSMDMRTDKTDQNKIGFTSPNKNRKRQQSHENKIKSVGDLEEDPDPKIFEKPKKRSTEKHNTTAVVRDISRTDFQLNMSKEVFFSVKSKQYSDDYTIGKILGEGACGKVYEVTHKKSNLLRAMKSMKKLSVKGNEPGCSLFEEVTIQKGLDHPNIVDLYDLYQDEKYYYMVTEYCCGGELFEVIQSLECFSEKLARQYMKQILSAVMYLHERGIVHRDLKAENLIFESKDENAQLKLIDFGISAKFSKVDNNTKKFSETLGTPYYMAPEVLGESYDEKCDVWSCGILMYICQCGYPPFNGDNDDEILQAVCEDDQEFHPDEWSLISPEAINLIKNLLNRDPTKRISIKEAFNHNWFKLSHLENPLNIKIMQNLANFSSKNKLRHLVISFIAEQVTKREDKEDLLNAFKALDEDGNGIQTKEELIKGYALIFGNGNNINVEEEVDKIMNAVDVNFSGEIDFTEFVVAALNEEQLVGDQKVKLAFEMLDDVIPFFNFEKFIIFIGQQWLYRSRRVQTSDGRIADKP